MIRLLPVVVFSALMACNPKPTAPEPAAQAPSSDAAPGVAPLPDVLTAHPDLVRAIAHPDRSDDDRKLDVDRRSAQVLTFLGWQPDHAVADLMAGRGYTTEILARAASPRGSVIAQNNAYVIEKFAGEALAARLARPGLERVQRLDSELETPGLPDGGLDLAFMGLFYHDSVWMETDRAAMNAAIFKALKPGGIYGITDHNAADGHGVDDVKTLHRIARQVIIDEAVAAGFVLDAESQVLRNPDDDLGVNVFDPAVRGKTDRFVLRFVKPR